MTRPSFPARNRAGLQHRHACAGQVGHRSGPSATLRTRRAIRIASSSCSPATHRNREGQGEEGGLSGARGGQPRRSKTLIPLSWVYDKLASARPAKAAHPRHLSLSPSPRRGDCRRRRNDRGLRQQSFSIRRRRAGLDRLHQGQQSIEFDGGSVFLQALAAPCKNACPTSRSRPTPCPGVLLPRVNQEFKKLLGPQKLEQISRLTGKETEGGAAYDANQPLAAKLVLKTRRPTMRAPACAVKNILDELNMLPPVRDSQRPLQAAAFSPLAPSPGGLQGRLHDQGRAHGNGQGQGEIPAPPRRLRDCQGLQDAKQIAMRDRLPRTPGLPRRSRPRSRRSRKPRAWPFPAEQVKPWSKPWRRNAHGKVETLVGPTSTSPMPASSRASSSFTSTTTSSPRCAATTCPSSMPPFTTAGASARKESAGQRAKVKDMVKNVGKAWKKIAEQNPGTPWAILPTAKHVRPGPGMGPSAIDRPRPTYPTKQPCPRKPNCARCSSAASSPCALAGQPPARRIGARPGRRRRHRRGNHHDGAGRPRLLKQVRQALGERVLLGAGTVLDPETAARCFWRERNTSSRRR